MARPRTPPSSRLSVHDWIQAGYAILAEEGHQGAEIDRLCERLAVTKAAFYWHFTDMAAYAPGLCSRGASCATKTAVISTR